MNDNAFAVHDANMEGGREGESMPCAVLVPPSKSTKRVEKEEKIGVV